MNKKAYYGEFGGQYVAESLMNTLEELDKAFEEAIHDPEFIKQYHYYLKQYVGRETPLYYAERLSEKYGTKIYLKREDLNHTGAHKINNVIGQILLAKRMGKKKVIAETGAGQHGVATATGAALFDMECTVYMGEEDIKRQALNVMRMEMLGAKVVSVRSGSNTLKDATNEAIRTWAKTAEDTFYIIGSAVGPYPYPKMVKEFQSVISREAKKQFLKPGLNGFSKLLRELAVKLGTAHAQQFCQLLFAAHPVFVFENGCLEVYLDSHYRVEELDYFALCVGCAEDDEQLALLEFVQVLAVDARLEIGLQQMQERVQRGTHGKRFEA